MKQDAFLSETCVSIHPAYPPEEFLMYFKFANNEISWHYYTIINANSYIYNYIICQLKYKSQKFHECIKMDNMQCIINDRIIYQCSYEE